MRYSVREMAMEKAISVGELQKTFKTGLRRKRTTALRGLNLEVESGQVFGFLGPNGAGKTTTIKILVGLIRADSGTASIFGTPSVERRARDRLSYLPELPNFYDYLSAAELLLHLGELSGLSGKSLKRRVGDLLEKVGLEPADKRPLRKYSKGMQQRVGIAQAMLADPDLYILDEPMGGLDPLGRRWMKDLIAELGRSGKTVFFSSHVLAEAEAVCDRVALVHKGRVIAQGTLSELLAAGPQHWEITVEGEAVRSDGEIESLCDRVTAAGTETVLRLAEGRDPHQVLGAVMQKGYNVVSFSRTHTTLEDLFVRMIGDLGKG